MGRMQFIQRVFALTGLLGWCAFGACSDAVCPTGTTEISGHCVKADTAAGGAMAQTAQSAAEADGGSTGSAISSAGPGIAGTSAPSMPASSSDGGAMSSQGDAASASMTMSVAGQGASGRSASGSAGMTPPQMPPPVGCQPSSEQCDGTDNDCDGKIDEALTQTCGPAMPQGECKQGVSTCYAGVWSECEGAVNPVAEVCDAEKRDENCDGRRNEGCDCTPGDKQECGNDKGVCRPGTETCMDGHWGGPCEGAYDPKQKEICDEAKQDEDCDGTANVGCECYEGQPPRPCPNGTDEGECLAGTQTCSGGRWGTCSGARGPQTEKCNDKDDDCDGQVDEDSSDCRSPLTCRSGRCDACTAGQDEACAGNDIGECMPPRRKCENGQWGACTGGKTSSSEKCDGLDNDCDRRTDEDATGCSGNESCTNGKCVSNCGNGKLDSEQEECDPSVVGWDQICGSDCRRRLYAPCAEIGTSCSGGTCAYYTQFLSGGGTMTLGPLCAPECQTMSQCKVPPGYAPLCTFRACAIQCNGSKCPNGMRCDTAGLFDVDGAYTGDVKLCVPE